VTPISIAILNLVLQQPTGTAPHDPDEGTLSSVRPRIPEPMVFDLVRPLGAKRGEFEINSLFRVPFDRSRALYWAPEVEYTFADGCGIEFELPLRNRGVESYKAAIQATLPGTWKGRFVHGVQAIGEVAGEGGHQIDALHLVGYRWNSRWSTFSMAGARRERSEAVGVAPLVNHTFFRKQSRDVTLGAEFNWKGRAVEPRSFLFMPQAHWRRSRVNVQAGAGFGRRSGGSFPMLSWRISREF